MVKRFSKDYVSYRMLTELEHVEIKYDVHEDTNEVNLLEKKELKLRHFYS